MPVRDRLSNTYRRWTHTAEQRQARLDRRTMTKPKRVAMLLIAVALVSGVLLNTMSAAASPLAEKTKLAAPGVQIISNMNNRCVTLAHFNVGDGASVHMYDCNGATTQRWARNGSELQSSFSTKCLELPFGNADNGASVSVFSCSGLPQQSWHWNGSELHTDINHRCLTIADSNWWVGSALVIRDCASTPNQQFRESL